MLQDPSFDSFQTRRVLKTAYGEYHYFCLKALDKKIGGLDKLPFCLKVLLENLLRFEDGVAVRADHIKAFGNWSKKPHLGHEIAFHPARVLMQDFTGVPSIVDLAAMRDAMKAMGKDPEMINPITRTDLVIDHSVNVVHFGSQDSFARNVELEMKRNIERYGFLKWGQEMFNNFHVVPPGTGICHQVNLEYLARGVWSAEDQEGRNFAFPDTVVGLDSHTTMVNGLGVLGWGVGGIEAEAAMLGQAVSMLVPDVVGFRLEGELKEGTTATDLVLHIVEILREKGVVGKFVEFYGSGLDSLTLADRATIANMAPEYGATCGIFPFDQKTLDYMALSARSSEQIALVKSYAQAQGMWRDTMTPTFTDTLLLELGAVVPSIAGPKRPQDRIPLDKAASSFKALPLQRETEKKQGDQLDEGAVVIAAITSCTNTSNPSVLVGAGLVARKAYEKGLTVKPWVKTSFAPGSQVVSDYMQRAGLQADLDRLGFNLVGYGCTTCIGNSGPLPDAVTKEVQERDMTVCAVLSGNRNFEGRINALVRANYLASPPLVVAYALVGSMRCDITREALGVGSNGEKVYLKDIWPSQKEINDIVEASIDPSMFVARYNDVYQGPPQWQDLQVEKGSSAYQWKDDSTYVRRPEFFDGMSEKVPVLEDIRAARMLLMLADSVTTDHISPAGAFTRETPAGRYLTERDIAPADFNSFGARRGNHEVMMRGTFSNIRIRNEMLDDVEGGFTHLMPEGKQMSVYDAAMAYRKDNTPLIVIAGKEYGTGSSRDWAAKGARLLGIRAVIFETIERIHRSNLIGMGVLPLQFPEGVNRKSLKLDGSEVFDITGIKNIAPGCFVTLSIQRMDGDKKDVQCLCRIDTDTEAEYFRHGGILHYVLRQLAAKAA